MSGAPTASSGTFSDTRTPEEHVRDFIEKSSGPGSTASSHERMIADMLSTYLGRWKYWEDRAAHEAEHVTALENTNKLLRTSLDAVDDFNKKDRTARMERYEKLLDDIRALVPNVVAAALVRTGASPATTGLESTRDPSQFRCVIMESPFKDPDESEHKLNVIYARKCMLDCLYKFDAPAASHLLYTQVLDDNNRVHRDIGIKAGLAWGRVAEATVVYTDRGISNGMRYGIENAEKAGRPIEYRTLPSSVWP